MAIPVRDANNNIIYIESSAGSGTIGDPYITQTSIAGVALESTQNGLLNNSDTIVNRLPPLDGGRIPVTISGLTVTVSGVTVSGVTLTSSEASPVFTRGKMRVFRFNPTVTAGAYAQYDSVGGLLTLSNAIAAAGRGAFLQSIQVNSVVSTGISSLRVILFDANPTASTFTNDAAIVLNFDDQEKIACVVEIGTPYQIDSNTFSAGHSSVSLLPKPIFPVTGTTLYAVIQANAAITFAGTADLDITFTFYDE